MPERSPSSSSDTTPTSPTAGLSGLRLDELLKEVQDRLTEIVTTRDRLQGLLDRQDRGESLTPAERREAEGLVEMAECLSLLALRARRISRWSGPSTARIRRP